MFVFFYDILNFQRYIRVLKTKVFIPSTISKNNSMTVNQMKRVKVNQALLLLLLITNITNIFIL